MSWGLLPRPSPVQSLRINSCCFHTHVSHANWYRSTHASKDYSIYMVQAIVPEDYNERQRLQAEFKRPQGYHKDVSLVPLMEKLRILLPLQLTIKFYYSVEILIHIYIYIYCFIFNHTFFHQQQSRCMLNINDWSIFYSSFDSILSLQEDERPCCEWNPWWFCGSLEGGCQQQWKGLICCLLFGHVFKPTNGSYHVMSHLWKMIWIYIWNGFLHNGISVLRTPNLPYLRSGLLLGRTLACFLVAL